MALPLRLLLIIVPILTLVFIVYRIKKAKMKAEDAAFWICFSAALVIIGIFPIMATTISNLLGFESAANFVFLVIIALLLYKLFSLSTKVSLMEHKLQIAIQDKIVSKKIQDEEDGKNDKT